MQVLVWGQGHQDRTAPGGSRSNTFRLHFLLIPPMRPWPPVLGCCWWPVSVGGSLRGKSQRANSVQAQTARVSWRGWAPTWRGTRGRRHRRGS